MRESRIATATDPPRVTPSAPGRNPVVSICVPTFNGKEYLAECIRSIRSQSFTDFEVVICDDRSSDGTLELARETAEDDPRFRFIANPSRLGLVGNWNNCVKEARGEWIKFVFQDDTIAPPCVEALVSACVRHKKLFAFCERDFIFEGTSAGSERWYTRHRHRLLRDYGDNPVISPETAIRIAAGEPSHNLAGEPTSTLIHRSVFREIGGFDDILIHSCDGEFWCRTMIRYGAVFIPENLASFRVHGNAATSLNLGERAFRTRILDELVIRYRFAFGAKFKPMRNRNLSGKTGLSLCLECAAAAARAWRTAGKMRNATIGGSSGGALEEWRAVRARCTGLQALVWFGYAILACRKVTRGFQTLREENYRK